MKNNHSCQAGQEAAQTPAAAESSASGFNRTRSKLAFDRLVEMGAKMGMENPLFLCHERAAKATTIISGKEYLNFSTYDYLDINGHPEITAAVAEAAAIYGTSAGASRLVGGERPPHRELEQAFAKLYGVEDCIAYVSGHATNVSTLGFLFGHRDAIFHDGLAHNSLVQGARLSGASPTMADQFLLPAIVAVLLGGTPLTGGVGGVLSTLIGTLIVAVIRTSMTYLNVEAQAQQIFFGVLMIAAIAMTIDRAKISTVK